jgi:phosphoglycolate phosphatase-like HAD superfamily hydrolase
LVEAVLPAIAQKKVFVFDWDGTLFDSMAAKTVSFAAVVSEWLTRNGAALAAPEVARLYRLYSGEPRHAIFRKIARDAGTLASDEDCETMSQTLFARNCTALENATLFDDVLPCLEGLLKRNRSLCVSSSVPQAELSHFVEHKLPAPLRSRLTAILGSQPKLSKGPGHLGAIAVTTGAAAQEMIMIGDDLADRDLSVEAGIDSVLVDRDGHLPPHTPHISSLTEITGLL